MVTPLKSISLTQFPYIAHGFFTRQGGTSQGLYDSLNCGVGSGDEAATIEKNRQAVAQKMNVPFDHLLTLYQVHSADVVVVEKPFLSERPKADAMVTRMPGIALGILTADCGPILLADPEAKVIAAAHAGWKGAISGIIENTIQKMEGLGAARNRISAALGPCIAANSYEVGKEFYEQFLARNLGFEKFFTGGPRPAHYCFSLPDFIQYQLQEAKIGQIEVLGCDTYGDPERFFSYRRATHAQEKDYGRQISVISLQLV